MSSTAVYLDFGNTGNGVCSTKIIRMQWPNGEKRKTQVVGLLTVYKLNEARVIFHYDAECCASATS